MIAYLANKNSKKGDVESSAPPRLSLAQIMECVTVNLTLVYAVFSYTTLKRKDLNKILVCCL